jgi:hypothetical protein
MIFTVSEIYCETVGWHPNFQTLVYVYKSFESKCDTYAKHEVGSVV